MKMYRTFWHVRHIHHSKLTFDHIVIHDDGNIYAVLSVGELDRTSITMEQILRWTREGVFIERLLPAKFAFQPRNNTRVYSGGPKV